MARTVKDPEERRRELLACAMRLFAEKGYDKVSVRAVAREAGVASGLAYHYFDSKQALFDAAIEEYARQCAERFCSIFTDRSLSLDEQLDLVIDLGAKREAFPYADFFHASEHGALHERLSLGICEAVRPSLTAALERDAATRGMPAPDAEMLAGMLVYGSIGLASDGHELGEQTRRAARRYVAALIKEFRRIDERKG